MGDQGEADRGAVEGAAPSPTRKAQSTTLAERPSVCMWLDTSAHGGRFAAMTIACIGWGSLCWDSRELPVGDWRSDGPILPIEFARRSQDGRVTLVICEDGTELQTLWAEISASSLQEAAGLLRRREGCNAKGIGRWPSAAEFPFSERVATWAAGLGLSGVVWTALPPKWDNQNGLVPTLAQLKAYLRGLDAATLALAREYLAKAPPQIETPFRAELLAAAGGSLSLESDGTPPR